jgi:phosphoenolpyruvate carboxykinase (ATP)
MKNAHLPSIGSHPKNLVLFTCETNGVLPPVAKLSA